MATTGTALVFPSDLPIPQELPSQSMERRLLPESGPFDLAVKQTDRLAQEDYIFPPYSPSQAEDLYDFWKDTLNEGAKWFSTVRHWPRPEGSGPIARRFIQPPDMEYIHTPGEGGYWRVIGSFEIRGAGELPVEPDPPSAWNPLDIMTAQDLPHCLDLTEDNRLATRDTNLPDEWEVGVRGYLSHGGIAGQRWYLELEVVSIGNDIPSGNQGMQIGLTDGNTTNILSRPPPSDSSEATGAGQCDDYLLAYSRLDGVIFASEPSPPTEVGDFGVQLAPGDIIGYDWLVGTSITVTKNGGGAILVPFTALGPLFPYFSAGLTLVDATNLGSTESCRIRTGRKQQVYRPSGATAWG